MEIPYNKGNGTRIENELMNPVTDTIHFTHALGLLDMRKLYTCFNPVLLI